MMDEMDEIWVLYADDGAQALDAVELALDRLKSGDGDAGEHISALFRAVHTFKGNSRVLGLAQVEGLAHLAEDLIGLVRDEGVDFTPEIGAIMLRTGDELRKMLDDTVDTRNDVSTETAADLKAELRQLIARLTGAPEPAPEDRPEAAAPPQKTAAPKSKKAAPADPVDDAQDDLLDDDTPSDPVDDAQDDPVDEDAPSGPVPTPTPPAAGLNPALAGLLDQLDGGDGADFDSFDDDVSDTDDAHDDMFDAPDDPVMPDEPDEAVPTLAEVTDGRLTTIDPAYRKIFADMVDETCQKLTQLTDDWDETAARRAADGLRYAAAQMSLDQWLAPLDSFLAQGTAEAADAAGLVAALRILQARDLGGEEQAAESTVPSDDLAVSGRAFFEAMTALYPVIADQGQRLKSGTPPDPEERRTLGEQLDALASPAGYVRLADAIARLTTATVEDGYAAAELGFFEELVHIEWAMPDAVFDADVIAPSKLLGAWSRDHIFETLHELRSGIESGKSDQKGQWFTGFETLMRRVHFACLAYDIETASQLTMALLDLFARVRIENKVPDVILLQMLRGFIDTMELVFDALDQGDTPDTSRIEKMFEDAASVCFVASGMVTAKTIETRLGLPAEFHRVLSPESVKTASDAIDAGKKFYVLRADLNEDDDLAQGFLECVTSDVVQMITNVTVFLGQRTLFDFLVASTLPPDRMVEQLAILDPDGQRLAVIHVLESRDLPDAEPSDVSDALDHVQLTKPGDSSNLLEAVGAISASHALLEHELSSLASVDLLHEIHSALHQAGVPPLDMKVSAILRDKLDAHAQRLQHISESGTQLSHELTYLQQESVAQRSHPAGVLLRALGAFVAAQAAKTRVETTLTHVGGHISLDVQMIEELREVLKALVVARMAVPHPPTRFHVSVEAESDHVRVELTDNSPTDMDQSTLAPVLQSVTRKKGSLRKVVLPAAAGLRFHLTLPQKMIVLDGMVVRLGDVCYVLPVDAIQRILQSDQIVTVSTGSRKQMLKLDEGGLVPIRPLRATDEIDLSGQQLFVIVQTNGASFAVPVDELRGQQLVLLRPLQGVLAAVRHMSGVAILSGGEIGLVLSVSALMPQEQRGAA